MYKAYPPFIKGGQGGFKIIMTKVFSKNKVKEKRRYLRTHMTHAEVLLWLQLKNKQLMGKRFLRQYSIDNYVTDFYCPSLKLAIEVDGPSHSTSKGKQKDLKKHLAFDKYCITKLSFKNEEIYSDLTDVLERIKIKIIELDI